jgi:hypothetical protein
MNKKLLLLSVAAASSLFAADDVASAFKEGKVSGQVRYYNMIEDNKGSLKDYFGSALGGNLKYETASLGGFKAGAAFYTTHFLNDNVSSTNTEPTATNKGSRYVSGLMDAASTDKDNVTNIGEAYLSYELSKTKATLGRMKLLTPFINPQDGRMIPTFEQGAWLNTKDIKDFEIQGGYINAFWNRSTSEWKSVKDSFGYGYLQGNAPLATTTASNYGGNTSTSGVYVGSLAYSGVSNTKLEVWDYYVQNIFNLAYLEGNFDKKFGNFRAVAGAQYISEHEVGNGGNDADNGTYATAPLRNAAAAKSYMLKGERSESYGAKAGIGYADTLLTFAATKTTDRGRFLFPREWGKEPFFTFQKRERTDGSGGNTAWLVTLDQDFKAIGLDGLSMLAGYGRYYKQDAKNFVLNKYGVPSYAQIDVDVFYKFKGPLKGLALEYLFARKYAISETYETSANTNFVFTKNGMNIHNLILNYNF